MQTSDFDNGFVRIQVKSNDRLNGIGIRIERQNEVMFCVLTEDECKRLIAILQRHCEPT